MPLRLASPTVGFIPTRKCWLAGPIIEPAVSVPIAAADRSAATAAADPELDPLTKSLPGPYGFNTYPPLELYPAGIRLDIKFDHSVILALPRRTTPAARSFAAKNESSEAKDSANAIEPALVCIRSFVSILSLSRIGIPCRGPLLPVVFRSRSRFLAISSASGLISNTALIRGLYLCMRSIYATTSASDVHSPADIAFCIPTISTSCIHSCRLMLIY
ncbi:hypothetical protein D3C78_1209470 [compost metagenome]